MPGRWGLGPVFAFESVLNARRWQVYAGRSLFVALLLVGMVFVWVGGNGAVGAGMRNATFQQMAKIGEGFFYALAGVQISLVMLAGPAASAGTICMDRARGTLLHMMVTDLSDAEIVLGKLGSRLAPVFGLIACGVPVTALAGLLGGIDFGALAGVFVVSMALGVLGCALAMAVSVAATKTHEVLMAVYMLLGLWLLALPIWWSSTFTAKVMAPPDWFQKANPYVLVFAPYNKPGFAGAIDFVVFVAVVLGLSAVLVGLTILRLRRSVVEQAGRQEKAARRWPRLSGVLVLPGWTGPTLDGNPVLWREWHRNRPSRLARLIGRLVLGVSWALVAWGTYDVITEGIQRGPNGLIFGFMITLLFGQLMLSATAPTALAEERVRGSLDALLATPLSTTSIVMAKWWGMYRRVLLLALLPLYVVAVLAVVSPDVPAYAVGWKPPLIAVPLTPVDRAFAVAFCVADFLASGAVIVSLGLALATWTPRLGRAVALSVIAFFAAGIGWLFVVEIVFIRVVNSMVMSYPNAWSYRWILTVVMSFSPIAGSFNALATLLDAWQQSRMPEWAGLAVVLLVKAATAGILLVLTLRTFDRCLGRVSEVPRSWEDRIRARPLPRPVPRDRMDPHSPVAPALRERDAVGCRDHPPSSPEIPSFETEP